jgi:hypothetical protein
LLAAPPDRRCPHEKVRWLLPRLRQPSLVTDQALSSVRNQDTTQMHSRFLISS